MVGERIAFQSELLQNNNSALLQCLSAFHDFWSGNRGFAEWADIFGDPVVATALPDRLLHHAAVIRIEGASYRLRQHADLIPEHVRANAPIMPPPTTKKRGRPKKETRTDD